jgi:hypothetical protein
LKNSLTVEQITVACRHVDELIAAGITENLAIRTLELFIDVYANLLIYKQPGPHHVDKIPLSHWSIKARQLRDEQPGAKPRDHLRVEHGTPRRGLARKVLEAARQGGLDETVLNLIVTRYYRLAVITLDEDVILNRLARSTMMDSPEARWDAAGIKF